MTESAAHPPAPDPLAAENLLRSIKARLQEIIHAGGFQLAVEIRRAEPGDGDGPQWVVDFSGRDADLLLESRAELLDALAYIAMKSARINDDFFTQILFDCRGYRSARAKELKLMAQLAAAQAAESGEPFDMSPMSAAERRTVHLALKDVPHVRTESQGFGPSRHVVILPASSSSSERRH